MIQKIVIVNGNPESGESNLNSFLIETVNQLKESGISTACYSLSEKNIKSCVGCWDCSCLSHFNIKSSISLCL